MQANNKKIDELEDIEKLNTQIANLDERLVKKYENYPSTSIIYHNYSDNTKINWQLYFTIITDSNVYENWETIKNIYMLKFNATREYAFEIKKKKSYTIGCKTKTIKINFNTISPKVTKKSHITQLREKSDNILFWGIECKNQSEENNLPDEIVIVISQMQKFLKVQYNIETIENLEFASK